MRALWITILALAACGDKAPDRSLGAFGVIQPQLIALCPTHTTKPAHSQHDGRRDLDVECEGPRTDGAAPFEVWLTLGGPKGEAPEGSASSLGDLSELAVYDVRILGAGRDAAGRAQFMTLVRKLARPCMDDRGALEFWDAMPMLDWSGTPVVHIATTVNISFQSVAETGVLSLRMERRVSR